MSSRSLSMPFPAQSAILANFKNYFINRQLVLCSHRQQSHLATISHFPDANIIGH